MKDFSTVDFKDQFKLWVGKTHKLLNTNFDRAFGLDISDKSIEIAELSKLFHFSIENHGRTELPEGIIKDGRILDEKVLAEHIKLLLQNVQPRHVSTNKVILSLPESQVFIHHFVMNTLLTGAGLRLMVQKEIAKILPINPSRMYWDIKTKAVATGGAGGGGGLSVVFMGVQKDVAESYIRVCNTVGLDVVGLGLEPLSIARLLLTPSNIVTAIIDIGTHTTNISLMRGNDELEMSVTIPTGGRAMTQAIAQGLNVDEPAAEEKKMAVGAGTSEELFFLMEPVVKTLADEISHSLSYFETTYNEKVGAVIIVGGGSITGGIKEKISDVLGRPVTPVTHFNNFDTLSALGAKKPEDNKAVAMLYTSVIGLAMLGASNEFENINLLKQMPAIQINNIKRGDLFNSGYLSKTTALRIMLNSRLMLVISVTLCMASFLLFGYLWFSYKVEQTYQVKNYSTGRIMVNPLSADFTPILDRLNGVSATATSSATSTNATSTATSTASMTKKVVK